MSRWRVGVDSGGTFTDVCLFDEQSGPGRGLEGAVHAGRSVARHRPRRRGGHAPRRARGGASGGVDRLFRPRHHGRHQCADPASRREDRAHHHRRLPRPAGDRPPEAARPLRPAGRQAADAGAARPAPRGARARAPHRRDRHAARRGRGARRCARPEGGRREGDRRLLPLRLHPPRARAARGRDPARGAARRLHLGRPRDRARSSASTSGCRRWC